MKKIIFIIGLFLYLSNLSYAFENSFMKYDFDDQRWTETDDKWMTTLVILGCIDLDQSYKSFHRKNSSTEENPLIFDKRPSLGRMAIFGITSLSLVWYITKEIEVNHPKLGHYFLIGSTLTELIVVFGDRSIDYKNKNWMYGVPVIGYTWKF